MINILYRKSKGGVYSITTRISRRILLPPPHPQRSVCNIRRQFFKRKGQKYNEAECTCFGRPALSAEWCLVSSGTIVSGRCVMLYLASATEVELWKVKHHVPRGQFENGAFQLKCLLLLGDPSVWRRSPVIWIPEPCSVLCWHSYFPGLPSSWKHQLYKRRAVVHPMHPFMASAWWEAGRVPGSASFRIRDL